MMETGTRAFQEFVAEAQELVEDLARILMGMDQALGSGVSFDPDHINEAFRAVHTIKGLSGMAGAETMAHLAHVMEDLLDSLRMGRIEPSRKLMDILLEGVDRLGALLAASQEGRDAALDEIETFLTRLDAAAASPAGAASADEPALDPGLLGVLTEYEEHRLHQAVSSGKTLWFCRVAFDFASVDQDLTKLKNALKTIGEVISFLPADDDGDDERLALDVLVAGPADEDLLRQVVAGAGFETVVRSAMARQEPEQQHQVPTEPGPKPVGSLLASPQPEQSGQEESQPAVSEKVVEESIRSISKTVRVDIGKLDQLMNVVGELNTLFVQLDEAVDAWTREGGSHQARHQVARTRRAVARSLTNLQQMVLDVRMVTLERLFDRLSRVVRKLSRTTGKDVAFYVSGAETPLDKLIIEDLSDPLMHVIRNAVDHGIEPPEERAGLGKASEGILSLRARQQGNHVIIEVEDDGRGIDRDRVIEVSVEKGLVTEEQAQAMTDRDVFNLIFAPGFSTRKDVSETSGRGVGLDVVKTNLMRLSGLIDVDSTPGLGTRFTITVPTTLAIVRSLTVQVAEQVYAVPLSAVLEAVAIEPSRIETIGNREVISLRGTTLPIVRLDRLFGLGAKNGDQDKKFIIVVGLAQNRVGLLVDDLYHQRDIVIKSLGPVLGQVPGIAGATISGAQQALLVLDLASLMETVLEG